MSTDKYKVVIQTYKGPYSEHKWHFNVSTINSAGKIMAGREQ